MFLCLDIGNTHIYGGAFIDDELQFNFRYPSTNPITSDTFGIFLKDVLAQRGFAKQTITAIHLCSVVPALNYSIHSACQKYFNLKPNSLTASNQDKLKLPINQPDSLGADRVANAIAAMHFHPQQNILIVDFGTATTICAISYEQVYLGGAILPGVKLSMESLSKNTAQLSDILIGMPEHTLGKTTLSQLQCGLLYGQFGAVKEISERMISEGFAEQPVIKIATGGYAHLFQNLDFFDIHHANLTLHGLRLTSQ